MIRIPVHPWDVAELPPKPVAEGMSSPPAEFNENGYYEPGVFEEAELGYDEDSDGHVQSVHQVG